MRRSAVRIAQIAPPWLPVPPDGYGGVEAVVAFLTDGLVDRGHDVTLFAPGSSRTKARLVSYHREPLGTVTQVEDPTAAVPHLLHAHQRGSRFDVLHDHAFPFGPSIATQIDGPPVVHTVHTSVDVPNMARIYERVGRRVHLVAVSDSQREGWTGPPFIAMVHNGIAVEDHPLRRSKQDYLLFVGRMSPWKGAHVAARIAHATGRRLLMAAKLAEPAEHRYFDAQVRPLLSDRIVFLGEVGYREKMDLFANAACTVVPILGAEPFGLVMVESLACGTPVVAFRNGAAAEIIDHGVTGFLADDVDEFIALVRRVDELEPWACRRSAQERFAASAMVESYERVYRAVLA
jgi:hypothetical protein